MVQKLQPFYLRGGFCLLVELQRGGSAPAACAAGLFEVVCTQRLDSMYVEKKNIFLHISVSWQNLHMCLLIIYLKRHIWQKYIKLQ